MFKIQALASSIESWIANVHTVYFMKRIDKDTNQKISNGNDAAPGKSTLSSNVAEDNLDH